METICYCASPDLSQFNGKRKQIAPNTSCTQMAALDYIDSVLWHDLPAKERELINGAKTRVKPPKMRSGVNAG